MNKNYGLNGVAQNLEFGKNGLTLKTENGYYELMLADGTTLAKVKVADGVDAGDAVNKGQLDTKLDVSKVVTDINALAGNVADAPTVLTAINTAITDLIGGAPDALNTLNELAAALADDADFATSMTNLLANKIGTDKITTNISDVAGTLPDAPTVKSYVDTEITNATFSGDAVDVVVDDTNFNTIVGTNAQTVLDDIDNKITDVIIPATGNLATTVGVAVNDTDLGAFTNTVITDNGTVKVGMEELGSAIDGLSSINNMGSRKMPFTFESGSTFDIESAIPAGSYVTDVKVKIVTPFNDIASTLNIGEAGNTNHFMDASLVDIYKADVYVEQEFEVLAGATQAIATLDAGTSTQGSGYILISYC